MIDSCDPTQHWAEIGAELENAVATAVGDNFVWAYQRAEALAAEVARTFMEAGLDAVQMPAIDARDMGAGFGEFKSLARLEAKPIKTGHKIVTGMRGSYGGVLMFGMLDLVRRARACSTRCRWAPASCSAARPTRRTWRTG